MANTFSIKIEYNGKINNIILPDQGYDTIMKMIKEQLQIQNNFILQEKFTGQELCEATYLTFISQPLFPTFLLIEQRENNQQIGYDININPKQVLKSGLYLKYFRLKQITYYKYPNLATKYDEGSNQFVDIQVYGLKYFAHYHLVRMEFLQFLNHILFKEKHTYEWVDYQMDPLYLERCVEIFEFEEAYQHATKDSIKYEIIRQNRIKVYCHYYYFSQICLRYSMQSYKILLEPSTKLKEPNYQQCVFQFILCFIDKDVDQIYKNAIKEYFKPLKKPLKKNEDQFIKNIQKIIHYINYQNPIRDHNPNVGITLDENVKIDDVLEQLTSYWSPYGPFYDIHLTKQALYDAKYIIFLYNKYSDRDLNIIIDSLNYQLVSC